MIHFEHALEPLPVAPSPETASYHDSRGRAAWYAVQSKQSQEDRAEANLEAYGVETLLPRTRRTVDHHGRKSIRVEPLFPRYLFARCHTIDDVQKVRNTRGVSRVLGMGSLPTPVDDSVIDEIRSRIDPTGFIELVNKPQPGDHVRVLAGPLRDFVGVFESTMRSSDRVALLLQVVIGNFRVIVDADSVERVS